MNAIRALRQRTAMTQEALARAAGTSQPTIAAYEAGKKSPTLDTVQRLARGAGLEAEVVYHRPLTREDHRSLELHRAIAARLEADPKAVLALARRNLTTMRAHPAQAMQLLREWGVILDRPLPALLPVLTDPGEWARELRQVTPFSGVLSAAERNATYRAFADAERRVS
ncbi:MAG TPA: helix-turn-helix transcriptional regulator [Gemmatimonadaceae bacterium]